tara:strand:+ start:5132 stop:6979 length:1848 start_codon:yes stop_codon:yes gene_type:complete
MVARRPVVSISGLRTELPPGDTLIGASPGTLIAGSGLDDSGGGNLGEDVEIDVSIAPNPSGLIFVGNKLGDDGVALRLGEAALASGNQAIGVASTALASGNASIALAQTALASGNAALEAISATPGGLEAEFTASSTVAVGNSVGLDDLGKVRPITTVTDGATRSYGTPVVFETANSEYISTTYDSSNNRVVIAYADDGNSNYGTAVVGTVSGTSISFGTPVVFESTEVRFVSTVYDSTNNKVGIFYRQQSAPNYPGFGIVGTVSGTSISFGSATIFRSQFCENISAVFDSTSNKVVVAYTDGSNSDNGTAVVGTISGTSISFGSEVVFESAATYQISTTYDSTIDRVVIAYRDAGNSDYGTAVVGTVSGTSISFGTPVVYVSQQVTHQSATYDSKEERVVIAYRDGWNLYGTAIVGSVTGTSISFGTAVVFETGVTNFISAIYDSTSDKVVIAYEDGSNSSYGTAIVGTVSGTTISFGTAVVFEAADSGYISATYNSTDDRVVIAYRDVGNGSYGTAVVGSPGSSIVPKVSSLNNFIGVAKTVAASGSAVTVGLPGTVQTMYTGLVVGSGYYVDPTSSGITTSSTAPADWSGGTAWQTIGRAVSSTELYLTDSV